MRMMARRAGGRCDRAGANTQPMQLARADPGAVADVASDGTAGHSSLARAAAAVRRRSQLRDPNELYTDAVKNALIDAMLKFSGAPEDRATPNG